MVRHIAEALFRASQAISPGDILTMGRMKFDPKKGET
jgi:hypothetical protein